MSNAPNDERRKSNKQNRRWDSSYCATSQRQRCSDRPQPEMPGLHHHLSEQAPPNHISPIPHYFPDLSNPQTQQFNPQDGHIATPSTCASNPTMHHGAQWSMTERPERPHQIPYTYNNHSHTLPQRVLVHNPSQPHMPPPPTTLQHQPSNQLTAHYSTPGAQYQPTTQATNHFHTPGAAPPQSFHDPPPHHNPGGLHQNTPHFVPAFPRSVPPVATPHHAFPLIPPQPVQAVVPQAHVSQRGAASSVQQEGLTRLHHDIQTATMKATPNPGDVAMVTSLLLRLAEGVSSAIRGAYPVLFGSFPAGLSICASDLDVVILGGESPMLGTTKAERNVVLTELRRVKNQLCNRGLIKSYGSIVINAKTPIIQTKLLIHSQGPWMAADISMGNESGPEGVRFLVAQCRLMRPLRPLVIALKSFLKKHKMNSASEGYMSSFCLYQLIIAHLQMEGFTAAELAPGPTWYGAPFDLNGQLELVQQLAEAPGADFEALWPPEHDLGKLMVSFFRRYGRAYNLAEQMVSVRQGGVVSSAHGSSQHFSIESPLEANKDIGGGCRNASQISSCFDWAYDRLVKAKADTVGGCTMDCLGQILSPDQP